MAGLPKGHWFHFFAVAGNLHPIESLLVYCLTFGVLLAPPHLKTLFYTNCLVQVAIFLPFVQIPVALTGHMVYVDIGWPSGLVAIAIVALMGTGYWLRRWLICACYLLHGGRMALGALVMFGQATGFTYRFQGDLPRYRYAKHKWTKIDGMPEGWWWMKMQQDTFGQGLSNSVLLCVPAFLAASNSETALHPLEWIGLLTWLCGWIFESSADMQKMSFMVEQKQQHNATATLGLAPNDKFLWTLCRHPNYFGEWMAWLGFSIASLPSIQVFSGYEIATLCYFLAILLIPRLLYDCLVHWTGAGPAEHYSVKKRPSYMDYQKTVRCFFPFQLPFVDHHQEEGWPSFEVEKSS